MPKRVCLSGEWSLAFCSPESKGSLAHEDIEKYVSEKPERLIKAVVPGNFELDLHRAGIVDDPYVEMNARQLRKYEFYDWWLEREFDLSEVEATKNWELVLEGIDCFSTIWLNGKKIGESDNALIPHVFTTSNALQAGTNKITIQIRSANCEARGKKVDAISHSAYPYNFEGLRVRKPAHVWGWDITPRMALGGIWRPIYLREVDDIRFTENYLQVLSSSNSQNAELQFTYNFETPDINLDGYSIKLSGKCEDSFFEFEKAVWSTGGAFRLKVENPKRWWPLGYGEQNLYVVKTELLKNGTPVASDECTLGIRTVGMVAEEVVTETPKPDFQFFINDCPVVIKGTNWVPVDALHSRDEQRIPEILEMAEDLGCNMLRVWGGGVYESDQFYELCDRKGIMVWQDFMMACMVYPNDEEFQKVIAEEAESIIKRIRQHPSIVLWAGDNECDQMRSGFTGVAADPNSNVLTRKILPEQVCRHDPTRPYLPSSPWISRTAFAEATRRGLRQADMLSPEQHLWGPRDYFKSEYYNSTKASFISEIGYHGCPHTDSIKKFISSENLWPYNNNSEWNYHASNPFIDDDNWLNSRITLMANQIGEMFGTVPDSLDDFVLASQICQAEAKKYFIEMVRSRKENMSGIIWWNLIDCWPQFSDAIVDYYFNRKLAYYYIKRLQRPFLVMLDDFKNWHRAVLVINDRQESIAGKFRITDASTDEVFLQQDFETGPNSKYSSRGIRMSSSEQKMLLIKCELSDGTTGVNHSLCGNPGFDLDKYKSWLKKIKSFGSDFDFNNFIPSNWNLCL